MSTYIVPGTKLTSLTALGNLTDSDLLYVVDTETNISYKTTYGTLSNCVFRDVNPLFLSISGGTITSALTVAGNFTSQAGITAANFYTNGTSVVVPQDRSNILYLCSTQTDESRAASRQYVTDQLALCSVITPTFLYQNFMPISGGVLTGRLSSTFNPAFSAEVVNLNYVNSKFFPTSGGFFTGGVSAATPALGAPFTTVATVGYVESRITRAPGSIVNTGSAFPFNNSLNKHNNNGIGNSGFGTTYILDNDNKIRASGQFSRTTNGGFGFQGGQFPEFPIIPVEFTVNDGTEYCLNMYAVGSSSWVVTNYGNIYSAGDNTAGQLGNGDIGAKGRRNTYTNISTAFKSLSDSTVSVGSPGFVGLSSLVVSQGLDNTTTACAVYSMSGGNLWVWGCNNAGQLGIGSLGATNNSVTPVPANVDPAASTEIYGKKITRVAAANSGNRGYALAVDSDNVVYVAGWNGAGQLGLSGVTTLTGANTRFNVNNCLPTNAPYFRRSQNWNLSAANLKPQVVTTIPRLDSDSVTAEQVYVTGSTSYLLTGGQVWACGNNKSGGVGVGTFLAPFLPTGGQFPNGISPYWTRVIANNNNDPLSAVDYLTTSGDATGGGNVSVCAVTYPFTLFACTTSTGISAAWFTPNLTLSALYPTGIAKNSQISQSAFNQLTSYNQVLSTAFGSFIVPAQLKMWGSNASGQLGTGDFVNRSIPTTPLSAPIGIVKAKMVGQANNTTFFLLDTAGDIHVTGYVKGGLDGRGEGDVTKQSQLQKVIRPQGVKWINFEVFTYGAAGEFRTVFAQSLSSDLYVWGYNQFNQAGITYPFTPGTQATRQFIDVPIKIGLL